MCRRSLENWARNSRAGTTRYRLPFQPKKNGRSARLLARSMPTQDTTKNIPNKLRGQVEVNAQRLLRVLCKRTGEPQRRVQVKRERVRWPLNHNHDVIIPYHQAWPRKRASQSGSNPRRPGPDVRDSLDTRSQCCQSGICSGPKPRGRQSVQAVRARTKPSRNQRTDLSGFEMKTAYTSLAS